MTQLIHLSNGRIDLKFHAKVKNFKRVEKLNYRRNFFKLYVDKNDSVYDIKRCEVLSWKDAGGKKVPDEVKETRDVELFNRIKGNPCRIAVQKVMTHVDASLI